ncbi:signal peptide peptidase SppA [Alkalicaulis satelles]|uniref:Signal peptide peptidase SppA n=1 Tax=Alkalicaulis satelles TaxID=2609175 RepID=A0A5M6Z9H3_9PROT|nr:signal peptide peptidase SppA [Alkalicaulis satelles]KAA5800985.1 signal peptide peptidase SppA [Alkalicaulis satelles]
MKQFWFSLFGSVLGVLIGAIMLGVFLVLMIGGLIASAIQSAESEADRALPASGIVLELDLRLPRLDQPSRSPFAFSRPLALIDLVEALERARTDDRVAGVFVRANEFAMSPGQAEEIRGALSQFTSSGKFAVVHAQGFEGTGVMNYFAVAGAGELWLQPTASFSAVGLASETLFLGGLIEQFGAEAEFVQLHEYKNAADIYTRAGFTDAHREATLSLLTNLYDTAIEGIARDRSMSPDALRGVIEAGPYTASQAYEARLVDRLGHVFDAREAARREVSGRARFVPIETYARTPQSSGGSASRPVIALVTGQGAIVTGDPASGFSGDEVIGADRMAQAIDAAGRDSSVRAIVLRIDSPGGSPTASDQIWDAVMRARQNGKPVVVSMGSVAASGGYYIAAPADMIVANAGTLTGSIGMLGGKIVIDGALQRIGLNLEPLSVGGEYALAYSGATGWSDSQRAAYQRLAEQIYEDFTTKVADGRDLPMTRVQEIARGRVWTGAQAAELGLVDRIGGLQEAISAARELAGLDADEPVRLRRFPAQPTALEAFQQLFGLSAEGVEALVHLNALMSLPEVQAALQARQQPAGVQLAAPDAETLGREPARP